MILGRKLNWIVREGRWVNRRNMIKARNVKDWEEEVYMKSTLKSYRLANYDTGVER